MPEILDQCVMKVMEKGHDEKSAYAICKTSMNMSMKKDDLNEIMKFADEEMKKKEYKKYSELNFKDINSVEIFSVGKWNGDKYTESDLDILIKSFEETKDKLKPYLKLGHGKDQKLLKADELPAAGYISRVYKEGKKLLADFVNVPEKIYELIKRRAYSKQSAEIYQNIEVDGKKYPWALKAVALLGGETPAVHNLDEIMALGYSRDDLFKTEAVFRRYDFDLLANKREVSNMDELEKLKKENESLESTIKTLSEENRILKENQEKIEKSIEEIRKFSEEQKKENLKLKEEKRFSDIHSSVEKLVNDRKISPARAKKLEAIILSLPEEKKFSFDGKDYNNLSDFLFEFASDESIELNFDNKSEVGKSKSDDLDSKAKEFMAKNKVSYKEALISVARETGK